MIATEAGAKGINLQFCAMVVNYDLPWNPQRIEQRIGRCHRYGQKHDVVVVEFLNRKNAADRRVFQLLDQKLKLFEGVFGASDEVLGAIESGVDFEKRIADIYQTCRQPTAIRAAFDPLQGEMSAEINEALTSARRKLLENFDDEVREKLKLRKTHADEQLQHFERQLIRLARHELDSPHPSSIIRASGSRHFPNGSATARFPRVSMNFPAVRARRIFSGSTIRWAGRSSRAPQVATCPSPGGFRLLGI